jgi:hypothetical protein
MTAINVLTMAGTKAVIVRGNQALNSSGMRVGVYFWMVSALRFPARQISEYNSPLVRIDRFWVEKSTPIKPKRKRGS